MQAFRTSPIEVAASMTVPGARWLAAILRREAKLFRDKARGLKGEGQHSCLNEALRCDMIASSLERAADRHWPAAA